MVKKGDTLIEVMLAVGIFSMIAIAIVAVMSNGTSGAQTALETTLAREEIDTQAEALRFIHSSYVADDSNKNADDQVRHFSNLWQKIKNNAIELSSDPAEQKKILQYQPKNCNELYSESGANSISAQKAFIINPRALAPPKDKASAKGSIDKAIINYGAKNKNNENIITSATIYPRLVFGTGGEEALVAENAATNLYRAEGIYIIAVKDAGTTTIVGQGNKSSAFYDFYIRTCWYGSNADQPTAISTVIRLYDPEVIKTNN